MKINLNLRYLYQRPSSDILYYQRVVPEDLVNFFGKKKITIKLPTKDLKQAKVIIDKLAAKDTKRFNQLRGKEPFSDAGLLQQARDMKDLSQWDIPVTELEVLAQGGSAESIKADRAYLATLDMAEGGDPVAEYLLENYDQIDHIFLLEAWQTFERIKSSDSNEKEMRDKKRVLDKVVELCGNKPLNFYKRADATKFRDWYLSNSTPSNGKRCQSRIQRVFSFAIAEYDLDMRNPFAGLSWPVDNKSKKRLPFSKDELYPLSALCAETDDHLRWCLAIQMNTGCRLSEVIGLEQSHLNLNSPVPFLEIKPTSSRGIKTISSERQVPLTGIALWAAKRLLDNANQEQLFPKYNDGSICKNTGASNAINKWLRSKGYNKTTHCLRHAIVDRLREVGCPPEIISSILGHSQSSMTMRYGMGYGLEAKSQWLSKVALIFD
ncbi:tyrosine-type recombinase/integrase [Alphaproteobacteria bacterium]|nr:tyrosine-type recombinase/integrase [Alphaproteobacteria bacterium]